MKIGAFLEKEKLFLVAVFALLLILLFSPPGAGVKPVSPPLPLSISRADLAEAIETGRFPPWLAALSGAALFVFLAILTAGLLLNLSAWRKKEWTIFAPGPNPEVEWGVWPVVKISVYFLFLWILFHSLANASRGGRLSPSPTFCPALLLGNVLLQYLLILALVFGFLKKFGFPAASLRLSPSEWRLRGKQAVHGYVFFFPYLGLAYLVTRALDLPSEPHPIVAPLLGSGSPLVLATLFCIAVVLAPLVEEIFFRGFLYPPLKRKIPVWGAVLLSAALFATLHLNAGGWLPVFGLGALLAYSYERTGSLLVPVLIHAFHNALFLSVAVLASEGIKVLG